MDDKFTCIATCQGGLEEVLAAELKYLNIKVKDVGRRMVSFQTDLFGLYLTNMALRTAVNILLPLRSFHARNYDLLYYQTRKINWHKLFAVDKTIRIDVKGKSEKLTNSEYIIHRIKDSISDTFRKFCNDQRPSVDKKNPDIHIVCFLEGDNATIYLDTSGRPLFKRGYRVSPSEAPLKEDLAAGILLLSDWDRISDVLDPMCGSGTFLAEAYMIANNIAPNLKRDFSFKHLFDFTPELFQKAQNLLNGMIRKSSTKFIGFEIDKSTYQKSIRNIKKMEGLGIIDILNEDFRKTEKQFNGWFIVTNPPYGERLEAEKNLIPLYKDLGDFLKQKCTGSRATIFTANLTAGKFIGLRPSQKKILYNGPLVARLLKFDIY